MRKELVNPATPVSPIWKTMLINAQRRTASRES
ncbi:hypothetical protein vBEcoMWL3_gp108 [Escherichia phage vB_EcoM_WL-3]|nr:hypothetical protein vBEcoMWL3_gp108 [Escherichia phage vB_EcoM_WL-3]